MSDNSGHRKVEDVGGTSGLHVDDRILDSMSSEH